MQNFTYLYLLFEEFGSHDRLVAAFDLVLTKRPTPDYNLCNQRST